MAAERILVPVVIKPKEKEIEEPLKPIEDASEAIIASPTPLRWKV